MQRKRWVAFTLGLIALAVLGGAGSQAQKRTRGGSSTGTQTDLGLSGYGAFTGAVTNLNHGQESQSATSSGGGMLEFRQIWSGLVGFESTYSLQRANQYFDYRSPFPTIPVCKPSPCNPPSVAPLMTSVSAMTHEVSGDWIFSTAEKSVRMFALFGVGARITVPTNSPSGSQTSTSATLSYIYGFGGDWQFRPRWGMRLQYRGDIHKMPAVADSLILPYSTSPVPPGAPTPLSSPGSIEHDAEPMVGVYYRF